MISLTRPMVILFQLCQQSRTAYMKIVVAVYHHWCYISTLVNDSALATSLRTWLWVYSSPAITNKIEIEKMLPCPAKEYTIDAAIFHKCNMFKIIPTQHACRQYCDNTLNISPATLLIEQAMIHCRNLCWMHYTSN